MSCLGYSKRTTPNLDGLASAGMLFTQAISVGPCTPPSFISIFTSTYPFMYGGKLWLTDSRTTLAQELKEHGYHTAAFHSNPWLSSYHGYHKGFETFDDSIPQSRRKSPLSKPSKPKELIKDTIGTNGRLYEFLFRIYRFLSRIYVGFVAHRPYGKGEGLNRKAISWLRGNPSNFFLWLHYMDAHEPYIPSSRFTSMLKTHHILKLTTKARNLPGSILPQELNELIDFYDAGITYIDKMIGSLLRKLERRNILDNTFVIVTADHGQQFLEHGYHGHGDHGYDKCVYDELIHVPLIITGPGIESKVISDQVSLLDLAPTILDMLGIGKPKAFLGNSLLPLLRAQRVGVRNPEAISEVDTLRRDYSKRFRIQFDSRRRRLSLRTVKWKYIYTEGGEDELYHLESDPKETQNMIDVEPEIATGLRDRIMAHIEFEERSAPTEKELIKTKLRKLKSAGGI